MASSITHTVMYICVVGNMAHISLQHANGQVVGNAAIWDGDELIEASPNQLSPLALAAINPIICTNLQQGWQTHDTAGGVTTLVTLSNRVHYFTGSTTQTCRLPDVALLKTGYGFQIANRSTGLVTVQSSLGTVLSVLPTGSVAEYTCVDITGVDGVDGWFFITTSSGGVSSTGYLTVFDTTQQAISSANVWQNVSFNVTQDVANWTHSGADLTCLVAGKYNVIVTVTFTKSSANVESGLRMVFAPSTVIPYSTQHYHMHTSATDHLVAILDMPVNVSAGQTLRIQAMCDTGDAVRIEPGTGIWTGQPSARVKIVRFA